MTIEMMIKVHAEAQRLFTKYGLDREGWTFELSKTKRRVGDCHHSTKTIRISQHYVMQTPFEEIQDTLLHEIAHALVGPNHGHDYVWKAKARQIGARPNRTTEHAVTTAKPNFIVECSNCGRRWKRYRLKKSLRQQGVVSSCCRAPLKFYKVTK